MTSERKPVDKLYPLKGEPQRDRFIVIDIESKDGDTQKGGFTRPFLAGYYDGETVVFFSGPDCIKDCLAYMLTPSNNGATFFAHYGGSFDWLHFLPELAKSGYSFEIATVSSSIQQIKIKPHKDSKKKGWKLRDSYRLIPLSLSKASRAFLKSGVKDDSFDYDTHESDPVWKEYLALDLTSLYETLVAFHDQIENDFGGEVGMTAAATAMKLFRRKYQKFPIERHLTYHEFFRASYYGGRVEPIRRECSDYSLSYYDFNSCYPAVMREPMPVGKLYKWLGEPPEWIRKGRVGFARARVDYPTSVYLPCLPYRLDTGRLVFPVGTFEGVWDACELDRAISQGARVTWLDSVWIDAQPIFGEMVADLYQYRNKSNPLYDPGKEVVAKLMLNSLYGKFGMQTERERIHYLSEDDEIPSGSKAANPLDPDCRIYLEAVTIDAPYIAPQIASHVTALARLKLHEAALLASERGQLYYMDTDSVIAAADLSELCSNELGFLKDEGSGLKYKGSFIQPKLYCLEAREEDALALPDKILAGLSKSKPEEVAEWKRLGAIPEGKRGFLCKITMKGYQDRDKTTFDKVRLGESVTFKTLEKIGAMVSKSFASGPAMRTIKRQIRTEDKKRTHTLDGDSRPMILRNGVPLLDADDD